MEKSLGEYGEMLEKIKRGDGKAVGKGI